MGGVSGTTLVVFAVSVGTPIFDGPLAPFGVAGVGLLIFASLVGCCFTALFSGNPSATARAPLPSLVVLAGVAPGLSLIGDSLFMTMVAIIATSALATGICFLVIGRLRATSLLRFVPYSVSGGFLAGTGGVACLLALRMMGLEFGAWPMSRVFEPTTAIAWASGLLFGVGLFVALRRWRNALMLPGCALIGVLLCHLALYGLGVSAEDARQAGFLMSGSATNGMWPSFHASDLSDVVWSSVLANAPGILVVVFLNFLSMVLYLGGLELGSGRELNWDGEFIVAGATALAVAPGGGPASCLTVLQSLRNQMFGAHTRLTPLFTAVVLGLVLAYGSAVIGLIPTPVVGGILLCTGLSLLNDWVVRTRRRLPATEFGILLAIFVTILGFGYLEGVGIGMLAAIVLFVFRLSRLDPVISRTSVREHRSKRSRSIPDRAVLNEEGGRGVVYKLRGYVFFGTAHSLFSRLEKDLRASRSVCVLADLHQVSGVDFSAIRSMSVFVRKAHAAGWQVIISGSGDQFVRRLEEHLPPVISGWLIFEPDVDRALERCEDAVLETCRAQRQEEESRRALLERVADEMVVQLDRQEYFERILEELHDWIELRGYVTGATLSEPGKPLPGMQLLVAGQASVFDSAGGRLRQYSVGDPVDVGAAFGAFQTDVVTVADGPCRVAVLTPGARKLLEEEDAALALKLYRYLIRSAVAGSALVPPAFRRPAEDG